MTHENFNTNNLINLIVANDIQGLKLFISEIASAVNANLVTISKNCNTLQALEAAGFTETDQYKKLYEINRDLVGTNSAYLKLRSQALAALSKLRGE